MPRKGYKTITVTDETIKDIDALVSKKMQTRPKVVRTAIDKMKGKKE